MPTTERYSLNDLQQAVLDTLAEELEHGPCVEREKLADLIQAIPGHDDVTGVGLGPCLAALKRRGLVAHPVGDKRCRQVYITATGMEYAAAAANEEGEEGPAAAAGPSLDVSLPTPPLEVPDSDDDHVTHIDPETCRAVLPERDREASEQEEGEAAPAPGHDFKRCRHCDIQFKRPDEAPIPDDRCERCHEEIENSEAFAETMAKATGLSGWGPSAAKPGEAQADELERRLEERFLELLEELQAKYQDDHAGDPTPPAVTTLQVAIHPPGTSHLHERTILLGIDDEGAGPYLTLWGASGPIEIDDLTTLDAIRREGARLLRQAHAEETA